MHFSQSVIYWHYYFLGGPSGMEEVMKAPVTETVEEVKAAAAEETEVKEEAPA